MHQQIYVHMISKMHVLDHWCVSFSQYQRAQRISARSLCSSLSFDAVDSENARTGECGCSCSCLGGWRHHHRWDFGGWMVRSHSLLCISECVRVYTAVVELFFSISLSRSHKHTQIDRQRASERYAHCCGFIRADLVSLLHFPNFSHLW